MRAIALKYLPITPDTYWSLTPVELSEMLLGSKWRRDQDWKLGAWVTAHLMNVSGKQVKKTIKPDQLLGTDRPAKTRDVMGEVKEILRRQQRIDAKKAGS